MRRLSFPVVLGGLFLLGACGGGEEPAVEISEEAPTAEPAAVPAPADAAADGALIDPETASREELLTVPGLDEATADALIAARPYADMRAVDEVLAGRLSEEQREAAYARLWKPLDLNTASAEEIELIPGVGERMRHEFEEYRPYRGIEQFRREIGKYVDEAEVARLERYVTLR